MDVKSEEEFANFLQKVSEVERIVRKMNSGDKKEQEMADLEAKRFLGEDNVEKLRCLEEGDLTFKEDRTVLNEKALRQNDVKDSATMDREVFMAEVSRDADKRYQDKLMRTEKMETLKKQATKAFRRGEYEKSLSLYTRAIELIKDSPLLYNNRAVVYLKLGLFEKAVPDLELALRLNEDCLRSWLLLAKAHYAQKKYPDFDNCIEQAKQKHLHQATYINEFITDVKTEFKSQ